MRTPNHSCPPIREWSSFFQLEGKSLSVLLNLKTLWMVRYPACPFFTFRHLLAHHVHFRRADFFPVACCHVCTFHSSTTVTDYQAQTRYRRCTVTCIITSQPGLSKYTHSCFDFWILVTCSILFLSLCICIFLLFRENNYPHKGLFMHENNTELTMYLFYQNHT